MQIVLIVIVVAILLILLILFRDGRSESEYTVKGVNRQPQYRKSGSYQQTSTRQYNVSNRKIKPVPIVVHHVDDAGAPLHDALETPTSSEREKADNSAAQKKRVGSQKPSAKDVTMGQVVSEARGVMSRILARKMAAKKTAGKWSSTDKENLMAETDSLLYAFAAGFGAALAFIGHFALNEFTVVSNILLVIGIGLGWVAKVQYSKFANRA